MQSSGASFQDRYIYTWNELCPVWRKTYHSLAVNASYSHAGLSRFYPSRDSTVAASVTAELHRAPAARRRANGLTSARFPHRAPRHIQLPANDDLGPLGNDRLVDRLQSKQSRSRNLGFLAMATSMMRRQEYGSTLFGYAQPKGERDEMSNDTTRWWSFILFRYRSFSYSKCCSAA